MADDGNLCLSHNGQTQPLATPLQPSQALLVIRLKEADHVPVGTPDRRHRSVRGVLYRAVQVPAHPERSLNCMVHVGHVEAQQRGIPARVFAGKVRTSVREGSGGGYATS